MVPLILASTSVYRQQLMRKLGLPFSSERPHFDEDTAKKTFQGTPDDLCLYLGIQKARSLSTKENCTIGSDQMAVLEDKTILGKAKTKEAAILQLEKMQGKTHSLITSLAVFYKGQEKSFLHRTTLKMKKLSTKQIEYYLDLDQPYDCAGSYKIEENGLSLMESIQTDDFSAIQGLPLLHLSKILNNFGYIIPPTGEKN